MSIKLRLAHDRWYHPKDFLGYAILCMKTVLVQFAIYVFFRMCLLILS